MLFSTLVTLLVCSSATASFKPAQSFIAPLRPLTPSGQEPRDPASRSTIKYTIGTKVLTSDVNLYMIYYGAWTVAQKTLVNEFSNNISNSSWYKTTKLYYSQAQSTANKVYVNGAVQVKGVVSDSGSLGKSLTGSNLPDLVQTYISKGDLPEDENGIYFVVTSGEISESIRPDVGQASFCSDYCGYHITTQLNSGKRVQYAMVGNPTACIDSCAPPSNHRVSPNGDAGVDAMLSVLAHELTEAISDPISDIDAQRAWQDDSGSENADKCAWTFGVSSSEKGYSYNLQFSGKKYMIQQNWSPVSQSCTM
jgi:hypothetical protein